VVHTAEISKTLLDVLPTRTNSGHVEVDTKHPHHVRSRGKWISAPRRLAYGAVLLLPENEEAMRNLRRDLAIEERR